MRCDRKRYIIMILIIEILELFLIQISNKIMRLIDLIYNVSGSAAARAGGWGWL